MLPGNPAAHVTVKVSSFVQLDLKAAGWTQHSDNTRDRLCPQEPPGDAPQGRVCEAAPHIPVFHAGDYKNLGCGSKPRALRSVSPCTAWHSYVRPLMYSQPCLRSPPKTVSSQLKRKRFLMPFKRSRVLPGAVRMRRDPDVPVGEGSASKVSPALQRHLLC